MLLVLLIVIIIYWAGTSMLAYKQVTKAFRKYKNYPRLKDLPEKMNGFIRKDFGKWNEAAIIRGCFLRFPIQFFFIGSFLAILVGLIYLRKLIKLKFMDHFIIFYIRYWGRICCFSSYDLQQQFDTSQRITTPISISNHVQWFDTLYFPALFAPLSIIAKKSVQDMYVIAACAEYLQAILVDRSSEQARKQVFTQIEARIKAFQANPQDVNPVHVFAQGTTSNGHSILQFRNGAFQFLTNITIISLNYQCPEFGMGMDEVTNAEQYFITACLRPKLIVKKKVVSPNAGETSEQYRERCRQYLSEMTGFPIYDCNYKDIQAYEAQMKELKNKLKVA